MGWARDRGLAAGEAPHDGALKIGQVGVVHAGDRPLGLAEGDLEGHQPSEERIGRKKSRTWMLPARLACRLWSAPFQRRPAATCQGPWSQSKTR